MNNYNYICKSQNNLFYVKAVLFDGFNVRDIFDFINTQTYYSSFRINLDLTYSTDDNSSFLTLTCKSKSYMIKSNEYIVYNNGTISIVSKDKFEENYEEYKEPIEGDDSNGNENGEQNG